MDDGLQAYGHGLVLGKFMPAHRGHAHLIRFAATLCARVTVVVDCVAGEWPDADTRAAALREDMAGLPVTVVALSEPTPQEPSEHPAFWEFWRHTLHAACGGMPDALACAADYGVPLAEALGCALLPLDIARDAIPISATMIRADPWGLWDMMQPAARRPYLARVAVEGPESTGKSTIARAVAAASGFTYAPEWAQCFIEQQVRAGQAFAEADLLTVARGQAAAERSIERLAHRAVIADTSVLSTVVWSRFLHDRVDPAIERLFAVEEARAPRVRWFFTPDTPWIADVHRDVAVEAGADKTRRRFWDLLVAEAERRGLPFQVVPGGFAEKERQAAVLARALRPPAQLG